MIGQSDTQLAGIGASVQRKEDLRFITGSATYTDDINQPQQAHAAFLRSPHARARIDSVDVAEAAAQPGVLAILTGRDMVADGLGDLPCGWMVQSKDGTDMKVSPHPPLGAEFVNYVGEPYGVVIAETVAQARAAAELVITDFTELTPVVDLGSAATAEPIFPDIPHNRAYDWALGDKEATDAAFVSAAHVTSLELTNNRLIPNAMEPRAAVGVHNAATEEFTLYTTSQNPHLARLILSAFVQVAPEHKLKLVAPDVGGGFGSKIFIYPEETTCVWAASKVGRPVKWTASRSESFLADAHGRDHVTRAELALDEHGNFLGLRVHTLANLGAYLSTFASAVPTYLYGTLLAGQYKTPAIYVEVDGMYTNTCPVDAYRGAGRPEATFVLERIVEEAARELGRDPAELRRQKLHSERRLPLPDACRPRIRHRRLRILPLARPGAR